MILDGLLGDRIAASSSSACRTSPSRRATASSPRASPSHRGSERQCGIQHLVRLRFPEGLRQPPKWHFVRRPEISGPTTDFLRKADLPRRPSLTRHSGSGSYIPQSRRGEIRERRFRGPRRGGADNPGLKAPPRRPPLPTSIENRGTSPIPLDGCPTPRSPASSRCVQMSKRSSTRRSRPRSR